METPQKVTAVTPDEIAPLMEPVLVDLIALALDAKQAHWHVRGRHFTPVHEQLDTLIADARKYSDEVAERVVALGGEVDGRPDVVATTTQVPAAQPGYVPDDKVVAQVVEQLDAVISRARLALDALDVVDLVSQDVIIELLRTLEKHRWMFEAQVANS